MNSPRGAGTHKSGVMVRSATEHPGVRHYHRPQARTRLWFELRLLGHRMGVGFGGLTITRGRAYGLSRRTSGEGELNNDDSVLAVGHHAIASNHDAGDHVVIYASRVTFISR